MEVELSPFVTGLLMSGFWLESSNGSVAFPCQDARSVPPSKRPDLERKMVFFEKDFQQVKFCSLGDLPREAELLFEAQSHPSALTQLYVSAENSKVVIASDAELALDHAKPLALSQLDPLSISSLLGRHVAPLPGTAYRNLKRLNYADRVKVYTSAQQGFIVISDEFPYFERLNRQQSEPSTHKLFELLVNAVERQLDDRDTILLLSSGKDSISVLLAMVELGIQPRLTAVTYANDRDSEESAYASSLCRQLGVRHETFINDRPSCRITPLLNRYFQELAEPCMDRVLIAMLQIADHFGLQQVNIVDGTGNDAYAGQIPTRGQQIKLALSRMTGINRLPLSKLASPACPYQWLFLNEAELFLEDANLMKEQLSKILWSPCDPSVFWSDLANKSSFQDDSDLKAYVRCKFMDGQTYQDRTRSLAKLTDSRPVLPWCDESIADYVFNLPKEHKYDKQQQLNKILIRQMLQERINYPCETLKKRSFSFRFRPFYEKNKEWVFEEILQCPLISDSGRRYVEHIRQRESSERWLVISQLLFQLAGWANHCRFLRLAS